ncbi:MAG: hypothetical protein H6541_02985 [Lentimicrobiaceae bacterium]|nr:hypothetical protein [Lentimicrobiaceae bacterium]
MIPLEMPRSKKPVTVDEYSWLLCSTLIIDPQKLHDLAWDYAGTILKTNRTQNGQEPKFTIGRSCPEFNAYHALENGLLPATYNDIRSLVQIPISVAQSEKLPTQSGMVTGYHYIPMPKGVLLAIMDIYSRFIVGWSLRIPWKRNGCNTLAHGSRIWQA